MNNPSYIVVHHSVSPRDASIEGTEASINNSHEERFRDPETGINNYKSSLGWYIGYHYIIYSTGEIRKYRMDNEVGVHCKEKGKNFDSIGICMIGDFSKGPKRLDEYPSEAQLISLTKLCKKFQNIYNIPDANIRPHRYYALNSDGKPYKDCWGNKLPDNPVELFVEPVPLKRRATQLTAKRALNDKEFAKFQLSRKRKKLNPIQNEGETS